MNQTDDIKELAKRATLLRMDILKMLEKSGSGHPGGSLSSIDIMTVLYCSKMNHAVSSTPKDDLDRFVLSKGHCAPALYATLSYCGYFDKKELDGLRKLGSMLSGHPFSPSTPGVDVCTGSLGQGLSMAVGMALAGRLDGKKSTIYCMIGDGESQEGQIWEAAMSAGHYKLGNLVAILDNNGLQIDGDVSEVMDINPIGDKWRAFGWEVIEIDGHDIAQISSAIDKADGIKDKPVMIWAHTTKGKGVSFMENKAGWHGVAPSAEQLEQALAELDVCLSQED